MCVQKKKVRGAAVLCSLNNWTYFSLAISPLKPETEAKCSFLFKTIPWLSKKNHNMIFFIKKMVFKVLKIWVTIRAFYFKLFIVNSFCRAIFVSWGGNYHSSKLRLSYEYYTCCDNCTNNPLLWVDIKLCLIGKDLTICLCSTDSPFKGV